MDTDERGPHIYPAVHLSTNRSVFGTGKRFLASNSREYLIRILPLGRIPEVPEGVPALVSSGWSINLKGPAAPGPWSPLAHKI